MSRKGSPLRGLGVEGRPLLPRTASLALLVRGLTKESRLRRQHEVENKKDLVADVAPFQGAGMVGGGAPQVQALRVIPIATLRAGWPTRSRQGWLFKSP